MKDVEPAHVLVIEDDDIVARTIERSLRGEEFRVLLTSSGVEGLKAARRRPPDLVILDIIMPGMDGYTVCREMRSDPRLAEVPILFLTAKIKDEDKIAGFNVGADDYLCKPFNIDELILRLRAILRRARRRERLSSASKETPKPGGRDLDKLPRSMPRITHLITTRDHGKARETHNISSLGILLWTLGHMNYPLLPEGW